LKRNLPMLGDRKKDKMKERNKDSYAFLGSEKRPIDQPHDNEQYFFCEKCKKNIPERFWRQHKNNHKRLERMGGLRRKKCKKYT